MQEITPSAVIQTTPRPPTSAPRRGALPPPPADELANALGVAAIDVEWLAGDGSDRCYYRLRSPNLSRSLVLMQLSGRDAEDLREDGYAWIEVAEALRSASVLVPAVVAKLPDYAALIIEDYGNTTMERAVNQATHLGETTQVQHIYKQCFGTLRQLAELDPANGGVWTKLAFDAERYQWELQFFRERYLEGAARLELSSNQRLAFDRDCLALASYLATLSVGFTHRDFHSRNVMVQAGGFALLDFQDARIGARTYDLVSLVFDSYVHLPTSLRLELLEQGLDTLSGNDTERRATLAGEWPAVLLQRQLKAIGSFAFLTLDKGRGEYLRYVRPALAILEACPIADPRWPFLSGELLPLMAQSIPT